MNRLLGEHGQASLNISTLTAGSVIFNLSAKLPEHMALEPAMCLESAPFCWPERNWTTGSLIGRQAAKPVDADKRDLLWSRLKGKAAEMPFCPRTDPKSDAAGGVT